MQTINQMISQQRRRAMVRIACTGALTAASWAIAQRLAKAWDCDCSEFAKPPAESAEAALAKRRRRCCN